MKCSLKNEVLECKGMATLKRKLVNSLRYEKHTKQDFLCSLSLKYEKHEKAQANKGKAL